VTSFIYIKTFVLVCQHVLATKWACMAD